MTINQLAQIEAVTHNKKMPSDIQALLAASYFSQSAQEQKTLGDLSLPHFIRVLLAREVS